MTYVGAVLGKVEEFQDSTRMNMRSLPLIVVCCLVTYLAARSQPAAQKPAAAEQVRPVQASLKDLQSTDVAVRRRAARQLASLQELPPEAVPVLLQALRDPD